MKSIVNGVITYSFSRVYQLTNNVVTKYYGSFAMRVGGVLSYLLTDHLGSTSLTLNASGQVIAELRYKPFGETRFTKGNTPTDRRYTGQRQQADTGLYFYNARWYDPALGRFTSADTIIPGAGSPKAWDRYAYALNNPLRYADPSGHYSCDGVHESAKAACGDSNKTIEEKLANFGVTLTGEMANWTDTRKVAVLQATRLVGSALAWERRDGKASIETAAGAFKAVYEYVNIKWETNCSGCRSLVMQQTCGNNFAGDCAAGGGLTTSAHDITFSSMSGDGGLRGTKNVVHELGHAFDNSLGYRDPITNEWIRASNGMADNIFTNARANVLHPNEPVADRWDWQQSPDGTRNEIFGDMFIAWTYGVWNLNVDNAVQVSRANTWMSGLVP